MEALILSELFFKDKTKLTLFSGFTPTSKSCGVKCSIETEEGVKTLSGMLYETS